MLLSIFSSNERDSLEEKFKFCKT